MAITQTNKANQPKKKTPSEILKEQKIASFQEQIAKDKEAISTMEEYRCILARTDVVGLTVEHKTFGTGVIIEQLQLSITVKFGFGNKRFIMPSTFIDGFLTTENSEINDNFEQYRDLSEKIKLAKEDMNVAAKSIQLLEKR